MKRALGVAVAAFALVGSGLAATAATAEPAPVYCGANDVVDPVIKSVALSPARTEIGWTQRSLRITVKASDDCAVKTISAAVVPRGVVTDFNIYVTNFVRTAGTDADGTWVGTAKIPSESLGGVWHILRLQVTDTYFNFVEKWRLPPTMHLRHITRLTMADPADKVKSSVNVWGRLYVYGGFGTWKVQLQARTGSKGKWKKVKDVTTNRWGDYKGSIPVKGTTYVRAVHFQDNTTTYSGSKAYKVLKSKKR